MPPIPKKQGGNKFEANLITMRKKFLQLFLNEVMRSPVLKSTEQIFEFLTNTKEKEFLDKMKAWERIPIPKGIKEMKHPNGKVFIYIYIYIGKDWFGEKIRRSLSWVCDIFEWSREFIYKIFIYT